MIIFMKYPPFLFQREKTRTNEQILCVTQFLEISARSDTDQAVKLLKMATGLKFWI